MSTYVAIANLAASKIGEDDQLRSPDDDTHLGRSVKAVWDSVRRAAIRDHSWNFAMQRARLAAEADAAVYPWARSFPLPAQALRLIEVLGAECADDYQLEGRSILSDLGAPLDIRYLVDIAEPSLWDELFVAAFACRLAWQIGTRIAGSAYDKAAGWRDYKDALAAAKRVDARENPPIEYEPTDWELARWGTASGPGLNGVPSGWGPYRW